MKVNGTNLSMIRGDTEAITITCKNQAGEQLPFETGDTVYLSVKNHINDKTFVFQKAVTIFSEGSAIFEILPEDTTNAKSVDTSVYDVKWVKQNGVAITIVPPSKFFIQEDVTDYTPEV